MRLLLDTHVAVWSVMDDRKLPARIRNLVANPVNEVFVSAVSIFEIAIKYRPGRGSGMPFSAEEAILNFGLLDFEILNLTAAHAAATARFASAHPDPFDRLILAQALSEPLRLITHDAKLAAYSDTIISW